MREYVLSDGCGRYIRKDNSSNRYVTIRGEKYAMRLSTYDKAYNILDNCISKNIRNKFSIVEINTKDKEVSTKDGIMKSISRKGIVSDETRLWLNKLKSFSGLTESMDSRISELSDLQRDIEKEIVDIQHYIEFRNLNAYQGWMATKMLQNRLIQRRKYKDELMVLSVIKTCKIDTKEIENLLDTIDRMNNRKYTPRILTELFDERV